MRNCELLWEYYKICDALGDFCGFADVDEVLAEGKDVTFRHNIYLDVYLDILGCMSKCDASYVHCMKTNPFACNGQRLGNKCHFLRSAALLVTCVSSRMAPQRVQQLVLMQILIRHRCHHYHISLINSVSQVK